MLNQEKVEQAATDVIQTIPEINEWKITTYERNELKDFSLTVELAEPSNSVYPIRFIRVSLSGEPGDENISLVSLNYGLIPIQYSNTYTVDKALKPETFDNFAESAMRQISFMSQNCNHEAEANVLTSLAYQFISKLIQILSKNNHPEV